MSGICKAEGLTRRRDAALDLHPNRIASRRNAVRYDSQPHIALYSGVYNMQCAVAAAAVVHRFNITRCGVFPFLTVAVGISCPLSRRVAGHRFIRIYRSRGTVYIQVGVIKLVFIAGFAVFTEAYNEPCIGCALGRREIAAYFAEIGCRAAFFKA